MASLLRQCIRVALTSRSNPSLVALILALSTQLSCATHPDHNDNSATVRFATPPKVGSWLAAQRELFACETVAAARYMADTGFVHARCTQLINIDQREYQVLGRSKVNLAEGPMWLLEVKRQQSVYWVPIPWHDWA